MNYQRRKAHPAIDWSGIDFVVGTRDDVTMTGIKRPCSRCGHDVFTSRRYPAKVPMMCEVCALALAEEDAARRSPRATRGTVTSEEGLAALDPWQRVEGLRPSKAQTPGRRRLRTEGQDGSPSSGG
jgi:hypothetical protein